MRHLSVVALFSLTWAGATQSRVADADDFRRVAYKGGSDSGVLNLTTLVTTRRGTRICFSATVNDAAHAVDESAFELAYWFALARLASL